MKRHHNIDVTAIEGWAKLDACFTVRNALAHGLGRFTARQIEKKEPSKMGLIPLTVNEIRRLFAKLITNTVHTISHWLAWSRWRRQHQARAKTSHYRRRGQLAHQSAST